MEKLVATFTLRKTGQTVTATLKAAAPPQKIKDFIVDEEGYITKVSETNGHNMYRLHTKANWDKGVKNKFITLSEGKVIEELAKRTNVDEIPDNLKASYQYYYHFTMTYWVKITNKDDAYKLFKFVCDASTRAEWGLDIYKNETEASPSYFLYTAHVSNVAGIKNIPKEYKEIHLKAFFHSHPEFLENKPEPEKDRDDVASGNDLYRPQRYYDMFKEGTIKDLPLFVIYRPHPHKSKNTPYKFQYAPYYNRINESKVEKYQDLYNKLIPTLKLRK